MNEIIGTAEAAKILGISQEAVIQAIWREDISARKLGREWAVDMQSVLDYKRRREERLSKRRKKGE